MTGLTDLQLKTVPVFGSGFVTVYKKNGLWALTFDGSGLQVPLPLPTASTIGGVYSHEAVNHQFLTAISAAGVPASAQPLQRSCLP